MNDQEKSVMLAKAMGWETRLPYPARPWPYIEPDEDTKYLLGIQFVFAGDLYLPANMALAKRCLSWSLDEAPEVVRDTMLDYAHSYYLPWLIDEKGQRLWLDKILESIEVQDV